MRAMSSSLAVAVVSAAVVFIGGSTAARAAPAGYGPGIAAGGSPSIGRLRPGQVGRGLIGTRTGALGHNGSGAGRFSAGSAA
jgi:hypothetical protein